VEVETAPAAPRDPHTDDEHQRTRYSADRGTCNQGVQGLKMLSVCAKPLGILSICQIRSYPSHILPTVGDTDEEHQRTRYSTTHGTCDR
jgi:hypothetical protein